MSGYAIVNLLEIDDSVAGKVPGLEARFGRTHLGSSDLGVTLWKYAARTRNQAHSHREQEEAYVVVAGSGRVRLDDELRVYVNGRI
jgi:quercetin dioxygenase-like cupin family protein